jgi:hypothetical protein
MTSIDDSKLRKEEGIPKGELKAKYREHAVT